MIFNVLLVAIYTLFTVAGLICYKYGTNNSFDISFKNSNLSFSINIVAIIGLFFYVISFLLYMMVLPRFNRTYILPIISAITSILIYVLSIIVLKEPIDVQKIIGAAIIIVGVFIMSFKIK